MQTHGGDGLLSRITVLGLWPVWHPHNGATLDILATMDKDSEVQQLDTSSHQIANST